MDSFEIVVSEKQIAKEILLKLIDKDAILLYATTSEAESIANLETVAKAYSQILKAVSE